MILCSPTACRACVKSCSDRIQVSFLPCKNARGFTLYKVCFPSYDRALAVEFYARFSISDTYKGFDIVPGSALFVEHGAVCYPYPREGV